MSNLLSNANKYTPDGGEIVLKAWPNGRYAHVSIQDNGLGISEENQQNYSPNSSAPKTKPCANKPAGAGPSIVRRMVEAQNGEVTFESKLGKAAHLLYRSFG